MTKAVEVKNQNKKKCSRCQTPKAKRDFHKNKSRPDGLGVECKSCRHIIAKKWREKHKDEIREKNVKRYWATKHKREGYSRRYRLKYPERAKEQAKRNYLNVIKPKLQSSPKLRAMQAIRSAIRSTITKRRGVKTSTTYKILGCNQEAFIAYLESQFKPWMTWDKYGVYTGRPNEGFDIDHITPLSTAKTIQDVIKLNHYTNLQPLCSYVNRVVKRDRVTERK